MKRILFCIFQTTAALVLGTGLVWAAPPVASTALQPIPPNITNLGAKPMLMVTTSKDHTLFAPIYTDFEDVNSDGVIDTTFLPTFTYYGFFDATKCYNYHSGNARFEPVGLATVATNRYTCPTGNLWSGNFLNWATMTRLDVIRKMLYGGKRSTDSDTETVLERVNLSRDSHSFVKYYLGTDIRDYTPFTTANLTKTGGSNAGAYSGLTICSQSDTQGEGGTPIIRMAKGNYRLWATVGGTVCDWGSSFGVKVQNYFSGASPQGAGPNNHESAGAVQATDGATYSNAQGTSVGPDLTMRVKVCDATLLGNEKCTAYTSSTSTVLYKPVGLFQKFGLAAPSATTALAEFGLISGSYDQPRKAGALRRNIGDFEDEIDKSSGRFCHISGAPTACTTALPLPDGRARGVGGIKALDNILLYGRGAGDYAGSSTQDSTQLQAAAANTLPAWGNPVGEMVVQALNYYAGKADSNPTTTTNDTAKGIPVTAWNDPLRDPISNSTARNQAYGKPVCRALNVLALSSSALSFDGDDADTPFNALPNLTGNTFATSLAGFTNAVGVAEGLPSTGVQSTWRSVGSVDLNALPFGETCEAKQLGDLSLVSGVCPEAPAAGGTYKVAGAAFYANTNRVWKFAAASDEPKDLPATALKVKTYAASLAGGVPRIEVLIPGSNPKKYVYITPESLWDRGKVMPGALLNFSSIAAGPYFGTFVMSWNDALYGGDYDMDITGTIRYDLIDKGNGAWDIKVTTDIISVDAGATGTHGFSIIGVGNSTSLILTDTPNKGNGRYLTHRHKTGDGNINARPGYLCTTANATYWAGTNSGAAGACNVSTGDTTVNATAYPVSLTFPMVGADSAIVRDPLWYAAKYGSFDAQGKELKPFDFADDAAYQAAVVAERGSMTASAYADFVRAKRSNFSGALPSVGVKSAYTTATNTTGSARSSWDTKRNDGNKSCGGTTGVSCTDGEPDGYFLARRPDLLEDRITDLLLDLVTASNAAPAISSAQLNDGDYKYIAQYDQDLNLGSVYALQLLNDGTGNFPTVPADGNLETVGVATWSTGKQLRATLPANRAVITNDPATGTGDRGVPFRTTTSFSTTYNEAISGIAPATGTISNALRLELIDFMRGDKTLERLPWRTRPTAKSIDSVMGSVINSSPWIQSRPIARYLNGSFPTTSPPYSDFAKKYAGRNRLLWVGANDGMLHSFLVKGYAASQQTRQRPDTDSENGKPVLSFVPSPLLSRLKDIARDNAGPMAGVDGSPFTADVLVSNSDTTLGTVPNRWRTYLFSSLGRGGRAIFALDVTHTGLPNATPTAEDTTLTEANAASIYKWTFSSGDDSDLGYVIGDYVTHPTSGQATPVVRLNNGKMGIIMPNGINSTGGLAKLFILQTDGPDGSGNWGTPNTSTSKYHKLTTDNSGSNALMGANWVDLDNNGTADVVYATDLRGRVWKFDISSSDPANWKSALPASGTPYVPFFEAKDGATQLPITTAPAVSYPPFGGVLVSFGTGKSLLSGDFPLKTRSQRFYTLWDSGSTTRPLPPSNLSTLVERQWTRLTDANESVYISGSTASIDWASKDGWYFNLAVGNVSTGTSEMVLSMPEYRGGALAFNTIRPLASSANQCTESPKSSLFVVNPVSGLPSGNTTGTVTVAGVTYYVIANEVLDQKVRFATDNTNKTPCVGPSCTPCTGATCAQACPAGSTPLRVVGKTTNTNLCFSQGNARIQWREIPGMRTQ